MDKLDQINRKDSIHNNLIKWWDVNMISSDEEEDADSNKELEDCVEISEMDDDQLSLAERILRENSNQNAFMKASDFVKTKEDNDRIQAEAEANEIYERLMKEAREDELKKQREIDEARKLADSK